MNEQEIAEYLIQVGKGPKGAYQTKYRLTGQPVIKMIPAGVSVPAQVALWYMGINIGNGYKKRLVCRSTANPSGKVIARERS